MSKLNDGGAAFPQWDGHAITGDPTRLGGGMSLRDWFAGKALTGWYSSMTTVGISEVEEDVIAKFCYDTAEAMIKERTRRYGDTER